MQSIKWLEETTDKYKKTHQILNNILIKEKFSPGYSVPNIINIKSINDIDIRWIVRI